MVRTTNTAKAPPAKKAMMYTVELGTSDPI
jgi:hypothetical protein